MHKYLVLLEKAFIKSIEYRSEIFIWLILDIVPTLILLIIWSSIYQGQGVIADYNLSQILQYYMIGIIFRSFTASHFENWRVEQIRTGKIDYFLTRPLPYIMEIFLVFLGGKLFYMLVTSLVYSLLWIIVNLFLPLGFPELGILNLSFFFYLMVISFLAEFFMGLITVILGFWFEGSDGLEHFKWILVSVFSGWLIPISMSPDWLRKIILILPIKYLYAAPIGIIQNKYSMTLFDFFYSISFVLLLAVTSMSLWQKAKLRYASAGG